MTTKHTRADYLDGKVDHETYYAQLVNERTIAHVVRLIGGDRLKQSRDPHFNDIQLKHWDFLTSSLPLAIHFRELGDYPTQAGLVCVAKQAARQYVNAQKAPPSA